MSQNISCFVYYIQN